MKSYSQLTDDDKLKIIKTYYNNKELDFKSIAKNLDYSERSISRVLQENGINTRLKNRYIIEHEDYFNNIDSEFKAYILGFIFADGYVGLHNDFCISLSDTEDNLAILEKFKTELGISLNINCGFDSTHNYRHYTLKFSNSQIISDLNKWGVHKNKLNSRNTIPQIDTKLYCHFIRGLFDGDGSICNYHDSYDNRDRYELSFLGTHDLLGSIQNILIESCDITNTKLHQVRDIEKLWRIQYRSISSILKIRDYLYENATIFLKNKHKKFYDIQPL